MELPSPCRTRLNLQPINSVYDFPPPPPYTPCTPCREIDYPPPPYSEADNQIIIRYNNLPILFTIGQKNCISYKTCLDLNLTIRLYTTSTGNGVIGQTIVNDIPFYIVEMDESYNTIGKNYSTK